jgi:hypothetical protein
MSKPDFSDYAHELWPQVVAAKSIEVGADLIADALRTAYAASSPEVVLGMLDRIAEQEADSKALGELLAVIHRDGGHYQEEKGTTKAVEDAHAVWAGLLDERDDARAAAKRQCERRADVAAERDEAREAVIRLAGIVRAKADEARSSSRPHESELLLSYIADPVVRRIVEGV